MASPRKGCKKLPCVVLPCPSSQGERASQQNEQLLKSQSTFKRYDGSRIKCEGLLKSGLLQVCSRSAQIPALASFPCHQWPSDSR